MSLNNLIYLADFSVLNSGGSPVVLKYSTKTFPGYSNRISVPIFLSQSLSINSTPGGTISNTLGEIVLQNADQDLHILKDYTFAGGTVVVSIYDPSTAVTTQLLTQKLEQLIFNWDTISIILEDSSAQLDNPLQTVKYLGNNVLPNGLEGTTELKDQTKPLLFGLCANISPKLVNSDKLIYQVAHNQVDLIINVLSNGAYLTRSATTLSSITNLLDDGLAPDAGEFTTYSGVEGTYVRLSLATGTITVSAVEKIDPKLNSAASLIKRIIQYFGYVSGTNYLDTDFTYIDTLTGDTCGLYLESNSGITVQSAVDTIVSGLGIWSGFDGNNKFRLYYLGDTVSSPILTVALDQPYDRFGVTDIAVSSPSYNGKVARVKEVNIDYDRNYTVLLPSALAGMVADELVNRSEWLSKEYRTAKKTASGLPANSQTLSYKSVLCGQIAAEAEAQRILDLLSTAKSFVNVTVQMPVTDLVKLYPGCIITFCHTWFGWSSGVRATVLSYESDFLKESAILTLWI